MLIKKTEIDGHAKITKVLPVQEKWWNLHFDGVVGKDGARVGFCINGPDHENFICSYKLYFDFTNNVSEYEALILGIESVSAGINTWTVSNA